MLFESSADAMQPLMEDGGNSVGCLEHAALGDLLGISITKAIDPDEDLVDDLLLVANDESGTSLGYLVPGGCIATEKLRAASEWAPKNSAGGATQVHAVEAFAGRGGKQVVAAIVRGEESLEMAAYELQASSKQIADSPFWTEPLPTRASEAACVAMVPSCFLSAGRFEDGMNTEADDLAFACNINADVSAPVLFNVANWNAPAAFDSGCIDGMNQQGNPSPLASPARFTDLDAYHRPLPDKDILSMPNRRQAAAYVDDVYLFEEFTETGNQDGVVAVSQFPPTASSGAISLGWLKSSETSHTVSIGVVELATTPGIRIVTKELELQPPIAVASTYMADGTIRLFWLQGSELIEVDIPGPGEAQPFVVDRVISTNIEMVASHLVLVRSPGGARQLCAINRDSGEAFCLPVD